MRAQMRGVKVHIMSRPPHTLKKEKLIEGVGGLRVMDDVGIKVRKMKHLKLHGKMLLADGLRAIVGIHQSRARQLRQPPRAGHRGARRRGGEAGCTKSFTTTGSIPSARS